MKAETTAKHSTFTRIHQMGAASAGPILTPAKHAKGPCRKSCLQQVRCVALQCFRVTVPRAQSNTRFTISCRAHIASWTPLIITDQYHHDGRNRLCPDRPLADPPSHRRRLLPHRNAVNVPGAVEAPRRTGTPWRISAAGTRRLSVSHALLAATTDPQPM